MQIITADMLAMMAIDHATRDCFGPHAQYPYLIIELDNTHIDHKNWLTGLPCPIIGLGAGALGAACDIVLENDKDLDTIISNIKAAPFAAMILVQHLRITQNLDLRDTLIAESFAYASLQQGPEFQRWQINYKDITAPKPSAPSKVPASSIVSIAIENGQMDLQLNDPERLNALGVIMRDALCAALDLALTDLSLSPIILRGNGRCFSIGGDVAEFGHVANPTMAHWIRSLRLPAWRLAQLTERLHIYVHGAAIGAGAEMAAFAGKLSATKGAWFQLPELKYGLIPGAGGTASICHRIGRQRTAFMALSMKRINAQTALAWGLVDEIAS